MQFMYVYVGSDMVNQRITAFSFYVSTSSAVIHTCLIYILNEAEIGLLPQSRIHSSKIVLNTSKQQDTILTLQIKWR